MPIATISSELKEKRIVDKVIENIVHPPLWWLPAANRKESEG